MTIQKCVLWHKTITRCRHVAAYYYSNSSVRLTIVALNKWKWRMLMIAPSKNSFHLLSYKCLSYTLFSFLTADPAGNRFKWLIKIGQPLFIHLFICITVYLALDANDEWSDTIFSYCFLTSSVIIFFALISCCESVHVLHSFILQYLHNLLIV